MKYKKAYRVIVWCISSCVVLFLDSNAVTLVYNLRVRRIFAIAPILEQLKSRKIFSVVPIYFSRSSDIKTVLTKLNVSENRNARGLLANLRYVHSKHWWLELTTGIEKDSACFGQEDSFSASRIGIDDLVIASGYRHFMGKKGQIIGYGLVGIPTRKKLTLADRYGPLVGTRLYNIGVGLEGSYSFVTSIYRSIAGIVQGRLIHGFNRSWFPVLPQNARIQPGNVSDLLLAMQYRKKRTIIETGYDLTIFSQQAILLANQTLKTNTFVRHGGYLTVSRIIPKAIFNKPLYIGIGSNFNYSRHFNTKSFTIWSFASIIF